MFKKINNKINDLYSKVKSNDDRIEKLTDKFINYKTRTNTSLSDNKIECNDKIYTIMDRLDKLEYNNKVFKRYISTRTDVTKYFNDIISVNIQDILTANEYVLFEHFRYAVKLEYLEDIDVYKITNTNPYEEETVINIISKILDNIDNKVFKFKGDYLKFDVIKFIEDIE